MEAQFDKKYIDVKIHRIKMGAIVLKIIKKQVIINNFHNYSYYSSRMSERSYKEERGVQTLHRIIL